ncbi:MAG: hypothetical protein H7Y12_00960 [Sphingobacteriaceae bacterium]|nr:hypothetical protein [Cytophagaceae bacterium]
MKNLLAAFLFLICLPAQAQVDPDSTSQPSVVVFETDDAFLTFPSAPSDDAKRTKSAVRRVIQTQDTLGVATLLITKPLDYTPPLESESSAERSHFFDLLIQGSVSGTSGTLLEKKDILLNGVQGKEYRMSQVFRGSMATSRNQLFVFGPLIYTVKYVIQYPSAAADSAQARFFQSFRIKDKTARPVYDLSAEAPVKASGPFPWGRLIVAAPVVLGLVWWLTLRLSRRRRPDPVSNEETPGPPPA